MRHYWTVSSIVSLVGLGPHFSNCTGLGWDGWVGSVSRWVGLDCVTQNGHVDNCRTARLIEAYTLTAGWAFPAIPLALTTGQTDWRTDTIPMFYAFRYRLDQNNIYRSDVTKGKDSVNVHSVGVKMPHKISHAQLFSIPDSRLGPRLWAPTLLNSPSQQNTIRY